MDAYSGKREVRKTMDPKRGCNMASKSLRRESDQDPQFCNRIGCSGRIKYSQNKRTPNLDISKCSNSSVQTSLGGKVAANSSSSSSVITTSKNPYTEGKRKLPSKPRSDSSESGLSSDSEASELVSSPTSSTSSGYHSNLKKKSGNVIASEGASSSGSSNSNNPRGVFGRKTTANHRKTSLTSSVSGKRTSVGPVNGSSGSYYGFRNRNCSSISDIVPANYSSSDSNPSGKNVMKKRRQEGERNSSSLRGERKTTIASSSSSSSSVVNGHVSSFSSGISIRGPGQSSSVPIQERNRAWTRRSAVNVNPRTGFSRQDGRNNGPIRETLINDVPRVSDNLISFRLAGRSSSRPLTSNVSSAASRLSHSLSSTSGDNPLTRTPFTSSAETSLTRLMGYDSFHHYNMDDIAEVLFALEIIEQDEELTHEQVRILETSLLLGGLNLYDQHRDMRLDIDNMSYEELLALEERMGIVSTALSEEEISKCLEKGTYYEQPPFDANANGDDAKCTICQEEYEVGDETGIIVECRHGYHMSCVTQWLRLKNWCPMCKGSAVSQPSS